VRGLDKRFGAVVARRCLDAGHRRGQKVSLMGANGAAKPPSSNMVTGYLKPTTARFRSMGSISAGGHRETSAAWHLALVPDSQLFMSSPRPKI